MTTSKPDRRFTFETFSTTNENRFANAAARGVASAPGKALNPVLLHGASGTGKTHLLHAIAHVLRACRPGARVLLISGGGFAQEALRARERGGVEAFRDGVDGCEALLVDDAHEIIESSVALREFRATVRRFHSRRAQVVLAAAESKKQWAPLWSCVCGLAWGMRVEIEPSSRRVGQDATP